MLLIVDYLNKHKKCPISDEDFITYMVYACMLYDGFNKMYENILDEKPPYKGKKKFFK